MSDQYEKGVLKVLRYVYNQMERCRNADFDALGITSSQASVMMFLFKNRKHEVTQQSVQAALLLSHPTITGLMKRLEAKGFITRKNSPADFRCKYVKLTKKGCDIERGLKTNMKRMQDRALVGLSQEELDNLEKSLCVIAENLRKEEDMLAAERIIQDIKERTKEEEKYDPNGADNPAWIQNVINADNQKRDADPYEKLSGTATQIEHVTVTSEDATNGHQRADCEVTLKFVTVDETVIHPESVQMGQKQMKFDLVATKEGDVNSAVKTRTGFEPVQLSCTVLPDCNSDALHTPYNREVIWSVSDTDVASISQTGLLTPNPNAQWIKDAEHVAPYTGTKTIKAIATTVDGQKVGETTVVLNYAARCIEMPETETLDLVLTMTGRRNAPTHTFGDMSEKQVIATTYQEKRPVTYSSSNSSVLQVSADGTIRPVQDAGLEWIKKACVSPYTGTIQAVITGTDATGSDSTVVTLKITVSDQTTYSSSSSGGGGGGGGGGSHSSKTVATSGTTPAASSLPEYVVRGTWTGNNEEKRMFLYRLFL